MWKVILNKYSFFLKIYILLFIVGLGLIWYWDHGDFILWWGLRRSSFFTYYFSFTDYLGEVPTFVFFALFFLFVIPYRTIGVAAVGAVIGLLTFLLKTVFAQPRPRLFFGDDLFLTRPIEGWHVVGGYTSFPSGHTSAAFALAAFLCYYTNKRWGLQLLLIWGAASVGLARVYGVNHFLIDIVAGSFLGLVVGVLTAYFFEKWIPVHWKTFRWFRIEKDIEA